MTDDENETKELGDLSDEEVQEISSEVMESIPKLMSESLGMDFRADIDHDEKATNELKEILLRFRDIGQIESEEEQFESILNFFDETVGQMFSQSDMTEGEDEGGFEILLNYYEESLYGAREDLDRWGYDEYFEKVDQLAVELIEEGKNQKVTDLYRDELDRNTGIMQRFINPLVEEHLPLLENIEIEDATEAREYQDMYQEMAELYAGLLPEFISVLQIKKGDEHEYQELKTTRLHNLLQKLGSKKYEEYNIFAECLDRNLRNSIVHRDSKINPNSETIEFYDRGDFADDLSYKEFSEESRKLFSALYALWVFNSLLTYHQIKQIPEILEDIE